MVVWKSRQNWWCGSYGEGGLCKKVVVIRRVVLVFVGYVLRLICGDASQSGRCLEEK